MGSIKHISCIKTGVMDYSPVLYFLTCCMCTLSSRKIHVSMKNLLVMNALLLKIKINVKS